MRPTVVGSRDPELAACLREHAHTVNDQQILVEFAEALHVLEPQRAPLPPAAAKPTPAGFCKGAMTLRTRG